MDMNWNQLQCRLSELLIWERVLRSTDMRQPMNAANLEKNLKEQAKINAAINALKQKFLLNKTASIERVLTSS